MIDHAFKRVFPTLGFARLSRKGPRLFEAWLHRARETRDQWHLASLPDHLLDDIGMTRGDVAEAVRGRPHRVSGRLFSILGNGSSGRLEEGAATAVSRLSLHVRAHRIGLLRAAGVTAFLACLLTRPLLSLEDWHHVLLDLVGAGLILSGVFGRLWAILHAGGRKSAQVVQDGPYAMCRHPLYLFSLTGILGFCIMEGSLILGLLVFGSACAIFALTARSEERHLCKSLGDEYARYARRTPMLVPRLDRALPQVPKVVVDAAALRRNLRDALVFLLAIPLSEALEVVDETGMFLEIVLP